MWLLEKERCLHVNEYFVNYCEDKILKIQPKKCVETSLLSTVTDLLTIIWKENSLAYYFNPIRVDSQDVNIQIRLYKKAVNILQYKN